ncbi:MAG: LysR family transcriptional regulator [Marinibacterium sp.]|nr:LysR family transcriptional regulator [Marinibacterium sp.]
METFVWVADLGSLRRPAERLNTTRPNISARVAGLQAVPGQRLTERDAVYPSRGGAAGPYPACFARDIGSGTGRRACRSARRRAAAGLDPDGRADLAQCKRWAAWVLPVCCPDKGGSCGRGVTAPIGVSVSFGHRAGRGPVKRRAGQHLSPPGSRNGCGRG